MAGRSETISFRLSQDYLKKLDDRGKAEGVMSLHEAGRLVLCEALDGKTKANDDRENLINELRTALEDFKNQARLTELTELRKEIGEYQNMTMTLVSNVSTQTGASLEAINLRFDAVEKKISELQKQTATFFSHLLNALTTGKGS